MWIFKPTLDAASKPHLSQSKELAATLESVEIEEADSCDLVEHEKEIVTGKVAAGLEKIAGSMRAPRSWAVGIEPGVITETVGVVEEVSAGAAVLARAACCHVAQKLVYIFQKPI